MPPFCLSAAAAKNRNRRARRRQNLFFYYNECPYCHDAIDYIDRQYPNLNMAMVNIHVGNGFELFKACGEKFRLGNSIGTPLFCMGDKYLMGWSENNARKFDEYVKPYLK